jgi:hypothetical protein
MLLHLILETFPITTTSLPEGGLGTFSPQFFNGAVSYAKVFPTAFTAGITLRVISESIADLVPWELHSMQACSMLPVRNQILPK